MNNTTSYNVPAKKVAWWFITYNSRNDKAEMTAEKLSKLLYYAQGTAIKYTGKTLFPEKIESSTRGPIVPEIHDEYKSYGTHLPVPSELPVFGKDVTVILQDVYEDYNHLSMSDLVHMSCSESPWIDTPMNTIITIEKMKKHFER